MIDIDWDPKRFNSIYLREMSKFNIYFPLSDKIYWKVIDELLFDIFISDFIAWAFLKGNLLTDTSASNSFFLRK
jgi:hypothetical protein